MPPRALAVAFASALAAACHEAVWPRLLTRWTGNRAWATGLALAVFMAGLGAGALLPALRPSLLARPRRAYALAELAVALGGALAVAALARVPPPSRSGALDVLAGGALLALPALAMGATFPLLVESLRRAGRVTGALYAAGLAGACAGVTLAAGALVPAVGADRAGLAAAALNALVALAALAALPADDEAGEADVPLDPSWRRAALLFAATGFFGLGAQAVWNRVLVPYAGVSPFAFASVVAAYVGAQALGVALVRRDPAAVSRLAPAAVAFAPGLSLASLALCPAVSSWPGPRDGDPLAWSLGTLAAVAAVVAPTAALLGAGQCLALAAIDDQHARGRAAAVATGAGTLASSVAPLLAALGLVPALGPRWALVALAAPLLAAAFLGGARRAAAFGAALAVAAAALAPGPRHFLGREYDREPALFAAFGAQDTTAVVLHDQPVEPAIRRLVSAGVSYSGDSLFAQRYMRLLGHLPALAARGRRRALVVCVGTGTTLDALRLHGFERVDAVDIDPTIRATLRYFAHAHGGAPDDPGVRLHVDDGDRFLAAAPAGEYDVITLEPPPPRAPGGSTLYALEFYERARRALASGGVVAQWLPLHDMGAWEAAALTATFLRAFPGASLHLAERNEAVLLSARASSPAPPPAAVADDLARVGFRGVDPVAETLLADAAALAAVTRDAPMVTRAWPAPELAPLTLPRPVEPLSAWAERVTANATPASPGTFAARFAPALAPFLRVLERAPRAGDREAVASALTAMLRERPDDPYLQYVHGFGDYLTSRLDRLAREGVDPAVIAATRARIERQRQRRAPERRP